MSADDDLDPADAYRLVRFRVDAVLRDRDDQDAGRPVPCCPGWTVRATVSHLVGVCVDVIDGTATVDPAADRPESHVGQRVHRSLSDLLAEWAAEAEQMLAVASPQALDLVTLDALSHEYDLRGALGLPPHRPDLVLPGVLTRLVRSFGQHLDAVGAPSLRLTTEYGDLLVGGGTPRAGLRTTVPEAFRLLTGRRTLEQAAALDWDGDPGPWLAALRWGPFLPPRLATEQPQPVGA